MLLVIAAITAVVVMYGLTILLVCQMRAELSGDLKVALDFPAVFRFAKSNASMLVLPPVLLLLMLIPAMLLGGVVLPFIGGHIVLTASQFMFAHFRAQLYLVDMAAGGDEIAIFDGPGATL